MSAEPLSEAPFAVAPAAEDGAATRGWIVSRGFDSALIVSAPLIGLLIMVAVARLSQGLLLVTVLMFLIGIPHYLSTFVFFAGDDQRAHYFSRPMLYVGAPLVIVASVAVLRFSGAYLVVLAVIYLWNIWHVSMQSAGVLSLYRHLAGGPPTERRFAHGAILTTSAGMAFWAADTFEPLSTATSRLGPRFLRTSSMALLAVGAILVVLLVLRIRRRPHPVSGAEVLALGSGLLLFHPMLWVKNLEVATFGMLIGHFVQYLALVWLIQARKYGGRSDGSYVQRALATISARPWAILLTIVAMGLAVYVGGRGIERLGQNKVHIVLLNSLALVHFYLDGLIWAFRRPFVRQALGPYVSVPSHRIAR